VPADLHGAFEQINASARGRCTDPLEGGAAAADGRAGTRTQGDLAFLFGILPADPIRRTATPTPGDLRPLPRLPREKTRGRASELFFTPDLLPVHLALLSFA
jgi:hypothetical protein